MTAQEGDAPKLPVVHTGKVGRPPYDDSVRQKILANLRVGCTRMASVGGTGVHYSTFVRWLENDEFRDAVEDAEAQAERLYTQRLTLRARAGDTAAIKFWLERRRAKTWRERTTVEIDDRTVEDDLDEVMDDDSIRERLLSLADEARRRAASSADGDGDQAPSAESSTD